MVKNQKGVTLVELLIVIVILGIIAAISVPAVGNIVSNAEKDAVLADATNLQSQVDLYCTSENDSVCDVDATGYDPDTTYFEEGGTPTLDDYINDVDGEYVVWYNGTSWQVAIETTDYYFAGNPDTADRDDVVDADTSTNNIPDTFTTGPETDLTITTN